MSTIVDSQRIQFKSSRSWVTLGLILGLLALRYLVTASRMIFQEPPGWIPPAYEVSTYCLIAVFLILLRNSLEEFHITNLVIWMIIIFKPIETLILTGWNAIDSGANFPLALPKLPGILIWVIALGLFAFFRKRILQQGSVSRKDWRWLLVGGLVGLGVVLITAYPMSFQVRPVNPGVKLNIFSAVLQGAATIPYQLGYAAISEEPVFRGFLWGYLRKIGWRDLWIWLFQGLLFVLAHLYYIKSAPISFWFIVPLGALVMGWLAWQSRSIATSMAAHGVMNGLGYTLGFIVALLRQ
jgi:membrane protease YdiL (CAAX protease family)